MLGNDFTVKEDEQPINKLNNKKSKSAHRMTSKVIITHFLNILLFFVL